MHSIKRVTEEAGPLPLKDEWCETTSYNRVDH